MKKKKNKYTDEPIQVGKRVKDFLPPPNELILKEETTKVTLLLTRSTIEFFKSEAEKNNLHYQTMIRSLLDQYTNHYKELH